MLPPSDQRTMAYKKNNMLADTTSSSPYETINAIKRPCPYDFT